MLDNIVDEVDVVKFLCSVIDSWKPPIDDIVKKIWSGICTQRISSLSYSNSVLILLTAYYSFIYPQLSYGIIV